MQNARVQGILIGSIVAVVTWVSEMSATPGRVSTFPDGMALLALVILIALAIRRSLGPSSGRSDVMRTAALLGVSAGAVIGVSTGIRGVVRWSQPVLPMVVMVAVTVVLSFVIVVAVTHVVALIVARVSLRGQRAGT